MHALVLAPFSEPCLGRLRARMEVTHESWLDTGRLHDPEELGARLTAAGTQVLVVEADFVFEEVFEAAPSLRLVAVCRNALNQVDIDAATERGIAVTHAPGRNTNAVAEMTLALMFALARRLPEANYLVAGGGWRDPSVGYRSLRGREVAGSTVGIVGLGQIGREVARKCLALAARVVAHDPVVPERDMRALGVEPAQLDDVASRADFVSLHVPEDESTHHLVDDAFLARMRRTSFLINTSGGSVVEAEALVRALADGTIAGAALDVFEGQPLPHSSPLMSAPNLILTPHIGGATEETVERHSETITAEVERFLDGEPLQHCVNPDYRLARAR